MANPSNESRKANLAKQIRGGHYAGRWIAIAHGEKARIVYADWDLHHLLVNLHVPISGVTISYVPKPGESDVPELFIRPLSALLE